MPDEVGSGLGDSGVESYSGGNVCLWSSGRCRCLFQELDKLIGHEQFRIQQRPIDASTSVIRRRLWSLFQRRVSPRLRQPDILRPIRELCAEIIKSPESHLGLFVVREQSDVHVIP